MIVVVIVLVKTSNGSRNGGNRWGISLSARSCSSNSGSKQLRIRVAMAIFMVTIQWSKVLGLGCNRTSSSQSCSGFRWMFLLKVPSIYRLLPAL